MLNADLSEDGNSLSDVEHCEWEKLDEDQEEEERECSWKGVYHLENEVAHGSTHSVAMQHHNLWLLPKSLTFKTLSMDIKAIQLIPKDDTYLAISLLAHCYDSEII